VRHHQQSRHYFTETATKGIRFLVVSDYFVLYSSIIMSCISIHGKLGLTRISFFPWYLIQYGKSIMARFLILVLLLVLWI